MRKKIILQLLFLVLLPSIVVAASSLWDSLVWDSDSWDTSSGTTTTTTTATSGGGTSTTTAASTTTTTVNADNVTSSAKSRVTYSLPYFHISANNVTYCVVSNVSSDNITGLYFAMKANSAGTATGALKEFTTTKLYSKMSKMITFSGDSVYFGNDTVGLSSELGSSYSYGGSLVFYSTNTGLNCNSVLISCFQGTSSPKRNVAGIVCQDNSTAGAGGKSIVAGY